jgi:hypothetical protein
MAQIQSERKMPMLPANFKQLRAVLAVLVVFTCAAAGAQSGAQKSYAQIKSLDGAWEGKTSEGKPVKVSFRSTAGGSSVMSEIMGMGHEDMVTMFYLDGPDKLMLTHYCGAGNQPRMRASVSPDGKTLTFDFVDATNLASLEDGHMNRVAFSMLDANHHTEEWTFVDHGKDMKEVFDLWRK